MFGLETSGNLSVSGLLLVLLCFYLLGGKLLRMYVGQISGPAAMRPRLVAQVVVLGDIGRSPRMRYHAQSLAAARCSVDLIGYTDTPLDASLLHNRFIRVRPLKQPWAVPKGYPKMLYSLWAPFKAIFLAIQLFWAMACVTQYPDIIMVQNPPSIPTLLVARFTAFIRRSWLIIDWHNFGYSVLAKTLGLGHPFVQFARKYERILGKNAYAHLTVTRRMNEELQSWGAKGMVLTLRDRPQPNFKRLNMSQMHQFLKTLQLENMVRASVLDADEFLGRMDESSTLLTQPSSTGTVQFRAERPRLIVSSTSWTEDEDFSILLDAAVLYEEKAPVNAPHLLFVITGKGPLKNYYEQKISKLNLTRTRLITAWLSSEDYPALLGCADLGVSLHTSTSGMDLPMKVVDMFGCGLPACAINFDCLQELVKHDQNGFIFNTSDELADQFLDLFCTHPDKLDTIRENVITEYANLTWENEWKRVVAQLF
ncbi:hypothetical protein BC940DRAFT_251837 [Gongronella butleri]|nr:hypothetical protein BC940DRAFT_251837 [Gongronella butleri]